MANITIKEIDQTTVWNAFVSDNTNETFHHSWEWGQVYKKQDHNVWYFGIYKDEELVGCALTIKVTAKRGSFLLVPHGPIFKNGIISNELLVELTKTLEHLGKENDCGFVRIAPISPRTPENHAAFSSAGYKDAPIFVQSEQSWVLNLQDDEEALLKNMRKSTRYILKRADTYGVTFERKTTPEAFEDFYNLYKQTVKSQDFFGQSKKFIQMEYETFLASNASSIYIAYHDGKPVSTALIIEQNNAGYYHYGASIRSEGKYIPAPQLLQWHIIKDLKARGATSYNFWGIAPKNKPKHPWVGLSMFKKGFGGEEHEYVVTQDYILAPTYWLNWLVETVRKYRRKY